VQILALIGLRTRERLVAANLELIEANVGAARAFFARHCDVFEWYEPAAGTVAFPRLRTGEDVEKFCERLVEKSGARSLSASLVLCCGSISGREWSDTLCRVPSGCRLHGLYS
jgi:hypothetical protein